ncbi:L-2-hydroxyglutarate oxidase [Rhodopirellula sp. MGV]|uniref:L-2-hydroxyglutarate oxidase n=1 Tax=Rhodopirellula sp. MGV TaxID=2023130 RepID=UPI000B975C4D|nr:L-2-hydroxyglutarate oxidase [Rhodopirellula sp. MGV]OYP36998.1 hydroxyglutarate oxidase [Rhodopirellula sp. MGV]PNY36238.1 L-2-hydroxyglutarate oxidase [Rhodopirellula baltica]
MPDSKRNYDFVVIGAGIVGLATASELLTRYPDCSLAVVDTENRVAKHQSGHNSGVIHSGIYYRPGSQRATTCRRGKVLMEAFCDHHQIPWERCGKVVVATNAAEVESLQRISERAEANGVEFKRINSDELREIEPQASGIAALHVPESGIVNYARVCETLATLIRQRGGEIRFLAEVTSIQNLASSVVVGLKSGLSLSTGYLINCAGLQCDRVAQMAGVKTDVRIVPFRGEYYELAPGREHMVNHMIYPVPNPEFPFLGVHFTRMIDGGIECGPNAVLALAREGYRWNQISLRDMKQTVVFPGFQKLAFKHWKTGLGEMNRSLRKSAFVSALQKLLPTLQSSDLVAGRAGVRAQAVSAGGELIDDFLIESVGLSTHVLNAPSPAATASLAIAELIVDSIPKPDQCA